MAITNKEFFNAIRKSLVNANELFEEAKILKAHNRIARSYTLFQLCMEEIGKASLIYNFILKGDFSKKDRFFNQLKDHSLKTDAAIGLDMLIFKFAEPDLKRKIFEYTTAQTQKISLDNTNDYKNYSLYTSVRNNKFYLPSEIINHKDVDNIESLASIRLNLSLQYFPIAIQEFSNIQLEYKNIDEEELISRRYEEINDIFKSD